MIVKQIGLQDAKGAVDRFEADVRERFGVELFDQGSYADGRINKIQLIKVVRSASTSQYAQYEARCQAAREALEEAQATHDATRAAFLEAERAYGASADAYNAAYSVAYDLGLNTDTLITENRAGRESNTVVPF